jgi:hypothetical protein
VAAAAAKEGEAEMWEEATQVEGTMPAEGIWAGTREATWVTEGMAVVVVVVATVVAKAKLDWHLCAIRIVE